MMISICGNCLNRFHCIIDSSADIRKCAFYAPEPNIVEISNILAERIADLVVERIKEANEQENKECESQKAL